jgi:hypothetical protein
MREQARWLTAAQTEKTTRETQVDNLMISELALGDFHPENVVFSYIIFFAFATANELRTLRGTQPGRRCRATLSHLAQRARAGLISLIYRTLPAAPNVRLFPSQTATGLEQFSVRPRYCFRLVVA